MKTDPDFHPTASAWIHGRASQPEQEILNEILTADPTGMREFAALCHTEVLLQQSAVNAASRHQSLDRLLSGKPMVQRAANLLKSRFVRFTAAAALLALTGRLMFPDPDSPISQMAPYRPSSSSPLSSPDAGKTAQRKPLLTDVLPQAPQGLELLLRRHYITDFKATGPLPDAVALLIKDIKTEDGSTPGLQVQHAGDAPVQLDLNVSLPAWTLLQIMALQSGTAVELSSQSIVFQQVKIPSDRVRSLSESSDAIFLKALLSPTHDSPATEDLSAYGTLAHHAFGSRLTFSKNTGNQSRYTGPARDVKVLQLALQDVGQPSIRVNLSMKLLSIHPESGLRDSSNASGYEGVSLAGVFTDAQMQFIMRAASQKKGVDLMSLTPINTPPNLPVSADDNYAEKKTAPLPITAMVVARPSGQNTCGLRYEIKMLKNPGIAGNKDILECKGDVMIWDGHTVVFKGFKHPDGWETMLFLTANLTDASGALLEQKRSSTPPALQNDLPDAIPLPWNDGFFISPFSAKGEIDLKAVKSGEQVQCPFTGKLFRKP